ncbi:hypothetical protein PZ938_03235 [Luteipulveratus sp. YIM 133132]|uniref:Uncharacterized protein n=1 Tax=Luteipulveratus flavus TaxID=3031728 RepID=A0ABT6C2K4_9MICO|nr:MULTISPECIES: hypothetical protein [unclassified Luteipulveratus]MDE9364607.1 hypothetical protein [Luteipulveratus sp. YIM 133132]MDF8262768.1 hypothetical protein [Luteipulveratus sp. YIM 133296]
MKKSLAWAVTSVAALTLSVGTALPSHAATQPQPSPSAKIYNATSDVTAKDRATMDRILAKLPADWQTRRDAVLKEHHLEASPVRDVVQAKVANVINPDDYDCGPTKLDAYVDSILKDVDPGNLFLLSMIGALDFPSYDALIYGTPKGANYQLPSAYASSLTTTFGYAQRFWDVRLNDVQLMAMHGTMMTDTNRVARMVTLFYGLEGQEAIDLANDIISIVKSDAGLQNGENPIFTLNAFAYSAVGETDPVFKRLKDKLVFGDGILAALKGIGLNQVGPKAVMGHEMAHHVQYEDNLFDSDLEGPEATRRTELMADSFGTYFVTHKKGVGLNANQVLQAQQAFYAVGDCQFDATGHHGTPNQRRAASAWGAAVVATSNNPNKVLPSLKLDAKFEKVLPQLVAPDAPTSLDAYRKVAAN